jgi:putative membrane protein
MENGKKVSALLLLKGMAMGLAEIIPGVSGGTIAFITGIYERLMLAIKSFDTALLQHISKNGIKGLWKKMDGNFLVVLFAGMALGLIGGAFGISYLIENFPKQVWAFFFGLIAASFFYVLNDTGKLSFYQILIILAGVVIAYTITVISPAEPNTSLWFVGLSGMIAVSALLLPGISGSFILLLLGMYTYILGIFKELLQTFAFSNLLVLLVFGLGCAVGAMLFSRVISWTFKHYRDSTLCLLAGFLLGSLNKIWPWRLPVQWINKSGEISLDVNLIASGGEWKILKEKNYMPWLYPENPEIYSIVVCILLGGMVVLFLSKYSK